MMNLPTGVRRRSPMTIGESRIAERLAATGVHHDQPASPAASLLDGAVQGSDALRRGHIPDDDRHGQTPVRSE
jgi:hypothetical protein